MNIFEYLDRGVSPRHVIDTVKERLEGAGFKKTDMNKLSGLKSGAWYIEMDGSTLMAFRLEGGPVRMACAHSDYPCFKIKPSPQTGGEFTRINTEPYGGMLKRTWFDRPLAMAGALWLKGDDALRPEMVLVDSGKPVCFIPSIAPHMDREADSRAVDIQKEMMPVFSAGDGDVAGYAAGLAGADKEDVLSYELNLYPWGGACTAGEKEEFILSKGIDNIASVYALTEAIAEDKERDYTPFICIFDNEEIGSLTKQGGDSALLGDVLDRLGLDMYGEESFLISADGAHSFHPGYPEKADPAARAYAGKGMVIKTSASRRYATGGYMTAVIKRICEENGINVQVQANRSGMPGGTTLGPVVSSRICAKAADVGVPMLAMHSAMETACIDDIEDMRKFFTVVL